MKNCQKKIKCSPKFALHISKSKDVARSSQLFVFTGNYFEKNINEDFMLCCPLTQRTTGSGTFKGCE
jgi:hypothetical protein